MRTHGTLVRWNAERGFGFIAPAGGGNDVFVHVSAFPRDGMAPRLDELVSFEIEPGKDGKPRACRVQRPGSAAGRTRSPAKRALPSRFGQAAATVSILAFVAMAAWLTQREDALPDARRFRSGEPTKIATPLETPAAPVHSFSCDGRTHCSAMHSCAEATYFLRNCPGTELDGDADGVPCEDRLCR